MCIQPDARRLAVSHFVVATAMIASRADGPLKAAADIALERRDAESITALIEATRGGPWEIGYAQALAHVAILTATDVLGDRL